MAIYMEYTGIKGDVTETGHVGWVELNSFAFGFNRQVAMQTGSGAEREPGLPDFDSITITKGNDVSSGLIMQESLTGKGKTVHIDWVRTSAGAADRYIQLTLTNAVISAFEMGGPDRPGEKLEISFTAFDFETKQMGPDASDGNPGHIVYDLDQVKAT